MRKHTIHGLLAARRTPATRGTLQRAAQGLLAPELLTLQAALVMGVGFGLLQLCSC